MHREISYPGMDWGRTRCPALISARCLGECKSQRSMVRFVRVGPPPLDSPPVFRYLSFGPRRHHMKSSRKILRVSIIMCLVFAMVLFWVGCISHDNLINTTTPLTSDEVFTKPHWCNDKQKLNTPIGPLWYKSSAIVEGKEENSGWCGTVWGESFLLRNNKTPVFIHGKIIIYDGNKYEVHKAEVLP